MQFHTGDRTIPETSHPWETNGTGSTRAILPTLAPGARVACDLRKFSHLPKMPSGRMKALFPALVESILAVKSCISPPERGTAGSPTIRHITFVSNLRFASNTMRGSLVLGLLISTVTPFCRQHVRRRTAGRAQPHRLRPWTPPPLPVCTAVVVH